MILVDVPYAAEFAQARYDALYVAGNDTEAASVWARRGASLVVPVAEPVRPPRGIFLRRIAATPRLGRGYSVETGRRGWDVAIPWGLGSPRLGTWLFRGGWVAAAGTWLFHGDESPRLGRGYSVKTSRRGWDVAIP